MTLLKDKMSKYLRDTDDVDVDNSGSTTQKKATLRNLASPIKVQFTPKLKIVKIVIQAKKTERASL